MDKELKYSKILFISLIIVLTALICSSLIWNIHQEHFSADEYAKIEAKASYNKDLLYRRWTSMQGGVYAPITAKTPANPYLAFLPERDIITETGKKITLINPAYMTRQVFEFANELNGVVGHITSLNPLRPENKADDWETKTLKRFDKGELEHYSLALINNREYMRYMGAMKVEDSCLKCHSDQGYELGDIRGGISVSVPMDKYHQIARIKISKLIITHLIIYTSIFVLLIIGYKKFYNRLQKIYSLQNKLFESQKAYKDVIETTSELITVVDKNGKIVFVNHASISFYGLHPEDCIGRLAFDFILNEDKDLTQIKFAEWIKSDKPTFYFENRQKSISGTTLTVGWNINIERNGDEVVKITSIGRDISERKKAEQILIEKNDEIATQNLEYVQINEELNLLIGDLNFVNNELNTARDAIEKSNSKFRELNADKDRFISILGHDLRNLFNTTLGFSELLLKKIPTGDMDKIEKYGNQINQSTHMAFNLLNDLLTWANAQSGKLAFIPSTLNIRTVCTNSMEIFAPIATEKNIEINYSQMDEFKIVADDEMIKTVIRNLISNALKFTNRGGNISIRAEQNASDIIISVTDSGVGMTPETMKKLFDVAQAHTTPGTANERGTGLGLLLCKEFIEKHRGKIWVESELGKGSEFKFSLPL